MINALRIDKQGVLNNFAMAWQIVTTVSVHDADEATDPLRVEAQRLITCNAPIPCHYCRLSR